MTRTWVDDRMLFPKDKRWVMRCGQTGCTTQSEPSFQQQSLDHFAANGWFIAKTFGDVCPKCLAAGVVPTDAPHKLMEATK